MPSPSSSSDLAEEVSILRAQLARLELRVSQLESEREEGFEFVGETKPEGVSVLPVAPSIVCSPVVRQVSDRDRVLSQIGRWIRTSLDGRRRGVSGRDGLAEPNRVYLIAKDFGSRVYNPVLVLHRWGEAEKLVKRKGDLGDSVFVGLPALSDAEAVCKAAELQWPAGSSQWLILEKRVAR